MSCDEANELKRQNRAAEEYAGRMEAALERIRMLCKIMRTGALEADAHALNGALYLIDCLATVKDTRDALPF